MTSPASNPAAQPFRRPMKVTELAADGQTRFRISAEPDERAALARFLGVDRIERLTLAGFIGPHGNGGWRVHGRLVAQVAQTCVLTLEPMLNRIEEDVERTYVPAGRLPSQHEVVLLHDDDDTPDPFTDSIDPAQLAVESLSLLIDPYPRREGAALDPVLLRGGPEDPDEADATRPFSDLAALLRRPRSGES